MHGSFDKVFEAVTADLKSGRRCFGLGNRAGRIACAEEDGDVLASRLVAVSLAVVVAVQPGSGKGEVVDPLAAVAVPY